MKTKYYAPIVLISSLVLFTGCSGKTYSYQIANNTYTSSSTSRENVLEEATDTCEDIDLKIKVLQEKSIDDETFIVNYKCLNENSLEYKKNENLK